MHKLTKECGLCGSFTHTPCRPLRKENLSDFPIPANDNRPPAVRAKSYSHIMRRSAYIQLGRDTNALQIPRREFPGWIELTLAEFTDRGGILLRETTAGLGDGKCRLWQVTSEEIETAFGLSFEENYGRNERIVDDCRWISTWWRQSEAGTFKRAPQRQLFARLQLIDLAWRVPNL